MESNSRHFETVLDGVLLKFNGINKEESQYIDNSNFINNNVSNYLILSNSNGNISFSKNAVSSIYFDEINNLIFSTGGIEISGAAIIALSESADDLVTLLKVKKIFRILDENTPHIKESYTNGASGYRIWSDGYCMQWGSTNLNNTVLTITFTKTFANSNYNVVLQQTKMGSGTGSYFNTVLVLSKSNGSMSAKSGQAENPTVDWKVSGYLAEGQY